MSKFNLKKLIAFIMALVLVMSVTVVGTYAEQKAAPLFTISDVETRQGEEFDVTIKFAQDIKPAEINIAALDVTLNYSSDVFTVVQVAKGAGLTAAFDRLSDSTKLHLETGDYIFGVSYKEENKINWALSTVDGFTFAKDTDFAVITFKAKDFSNLEGDLTMSLEVTNASTKTFENTTALYTPVSNSVKVDINLATLCDWEFDEKTQSYTLAKFNDKEATYFTIPDEYDPDNDGPVPAFPVTKIKYGAFSGCKNLQNVVIGENIKEVESGAFFNCDALKKITVYSNNVSFGALTFLLCDNNFVIRCLRDSSADKFAKSNKYKTEYFEDIASCNYSGLGEEKFYTGTPVVLSELKFYNSYNVTLKEGKDYTVEYENNTELGTATIHVTGKGEYWGTRDLQFEVKCPYHTEDSIYYKEMKAYDNCTEGGKLIRECSFCGLHDDTGVLPAKAHGELVEEVIEEPTCQKTGLKAMKCPDCGYYENEEVLEKIDCDMQMFYIEEPTCQKEGKGQLKCTMCGAAEAEQVLSKVDHDMQWITVKEMTCTEDGLKNYSCRFCGKTDDSEVIECPGTHIKDTDWVVTKEATCTEDGEQVLYCTVCGEAAETKAIEKKGHTAAEELVVIEATCTEDGESQKVCADCGAVIESTPIPATGHVKSEWTVIEEASCGKEGKEGIICTKCGKEYETKVTAALTHEPTEDYVAIKEATCTEDGIEGIVCQHCSTGKVYDRRIVKSAGHDYADWTIAIAPTCLEEGFRQSTCTKCGDLKIEVVPATGHNPIYVYDKAPTYRTTGTEKQVCEYCGKDYHKTRTVGKIVPDVNADGNVGATDALMILQHATEIITLEGTALKNADCDGNRKINSTDALLVLQLATGLITAD